MDDYSRITIANCNFILEGWRIMGMTVRFLLIKVAVVRNVSRVKQIC